MKKSIAFLGALLFGSVTFGQVTKNDTIKKATTRKVSADDVKKFPEDSETSSVADQTKLKTSEKHSSDASAGKGASEKVRGGIQKGKTVGSPAITEKMHYTIKMKPESNATTKDGAEPGVIKGSTGNTQKMQDTHIKMPSEKVAKDPVTPPATGTSNQFIKITDIKGVKEN